MKHLPLLAALLLGSVAQAQPYGMADVRSGANGCPAAIGDRTAIDTQAFQCQINYVNGLGSGEVLACTGNYNISGGITIPGAVTLKGCGQGATYLWGTTDNTAILLGPTCIHCGFRDLTVYGYLAPTNNSNAVVVSYNVPAIIEHATLWGGSAGLYTMGVDGVIFDCYIAGYSYGVVSNGANWYIRDKIDGPLGPQGTGTAYFQGDALPGLSAENHFTQSDFSGWAQSVLIYDTRSQAVTVFDTSVFSSPINIGPSAHTFFQGNEIGSTINGPHTCGANVFGSC